MLDMVSFRAGVSLALACGLSMGTAAYAQMGGAPGVPPPKPGSKSVGDDAPQKRLIKLPSWLGGPDEKRAKELYKEGKDLYQKAEAKAKPGEVGDKELYQSAATVLYSAARRGEDFPIEEDILFLLGESLFFSDQYPAANETFSKLLKKFSNSRYLQQVVSRQFLIARYWEKSSEISSHSIVNPNFTDHTRPKYNETGNSLAIYNSIQQNDPTGQLTPSAIMAAANHHFLKGDYDEASYLYGRLRKEHPRSEHVSQAHLLGIQSDLRRYQGPYYDPAPLKEVSKLTQTSLVQFPQELDEERENILLTQEAVRAQMAQRDFEMGEYYYRGKYYRAARFYYDMVLNEYPDTEFGKFARERLEETKDYPDQPPQHAEWLTRMFSRRKAR